VGIPLPSLLRSLFSPRLFNFLPGLPNSSLCRTLSFLLFFSLPSIKTRNIRLLSSPTSLSAALLCWVSVQNFKCMYHVCCSGPFPGLGPLPCRIRYLRANTSLLHFGVALVTKETTPPPGFSCKMHKLSQLPQRRTTSSSLQAAYRSYPTKVNH